MPTLVDKTAKIRFVSLASIAEISKIELNKTVSVKIYTRLNRYDKYDRQCKIDKTGKDK